ncbi:hypothetical protein KDA_61050 [Dictyobacter alpinus]|uniref:DUF304 domain-containing protein n=1 Tax=Dictyobacter alpinus TaxID=2014873 RepID=A0A402BGS8_9CHLR|nr:hypothetical protein [Dictyobacter alpinus]GCE30621.1 hypothetical protein KDA_61050 [Dictyobacter alpinus]
MDEELTQEEYEEETLFETRHHIIILVRPAIAMACLLLIMIVCATLLPSIYGAVGCISLLLLLACCIYLIREIIRYQQGNFVITDKRLFIHDQGVAREWLLDEIEGVDNLNHPRIPYPLSARQLRIRDSGGKTTSYSDIAQAEKLQQTTYNLIANQSSQPAIDI